MKPKRRKSGGRQRGTPNKLTRDERTLLAIVVNYGLERAQGWLERVARRQPARALLITARFAEFIVPRLMRTELKVTERPNTAEAPTLTAADVLAAYRTAPRLPATQPAPAAISPPPVAVPAAVLIEALAARREAREAGAEPPASPSAAPRPQHEAPVIDTAPDEAGVWSAPPPPWRERFCGELPPIDPGAKPASAEDIARALAKIR